MAIPFANFCEPETAVTAREPGLIRGSRRRIASAISCSSVPRSRLDEIKPQRSRVPKFKTDLAASGNSSRPSSVGVRLCIQQPNQIAQHAFAITLY